jgi:antitoxin PrlF
MKTIVSEKGQITLPKSVRVSLGIRPGTVLEISVVDGQLVGVKEDPTDPLSKWRGRGVLPPPFSSVNEYLEETRS